MKDTVSMVIATILLVTVLLLFPLYNYFERQDDMTYNIVLKATTNFVDETIQNGYVDQNTYTNYVNTLASTGYSYDISLEIHRRVLTLDPDSDSSNPKYIEQYEIKYNKDIFDDATGNTNLSWATSNTLKLKNEAFFLNEGDQVYVRVKNRNTTMAGAILNILTPNAPKEKIDISYGGTIKDTTWANTKISDLYQGDIYIGVELLNPNPNDDKNAYPLYTLSESSDRIIEFSVKLSNIDDLSVAQKLADNIKLVGDSPNIYISPSSVTSTGTDEYKIEFVLSEDKVNDYLDDNDYNRFHLFLPSNIIQGVFSKNKMVNSDYIIIRKDSSIEVPEI
ncbi:MAG: hypothetical protein Q4D02_00105 [Clostridia bacterium]|nr:hypothetical protein [Clostridia bacterium]